MLKLAVASAVFAALMETCALAEPVEPAAPAGCHGSVLTGTVRDTTRALIPGATVQVDGGAAVVSGSDGVFHVPCVRGGRHLVHAQAEGFGAREVAVVMPLEKAFDVLLDPANVEQQVTVTADASTAGDPNAVGPTQTLSGDRLQALADDPDDLQRQLTQMAAAAGGDPSRVTVSVDGFQGSSAMPPKSSIAYIKVNPDLFSAEYREPPFDGGRVEIYTKPGAKVYHGALFTTNGSSWMNAADPFAATRASLGKQRYGFELNGPVRAQGSDFALTMEHRTIHNAAVVDAVTIDAAGNLGHASENVATPQGLWLGTARVDWQLGAKNTLIASYSANVNSLENLGVGGTVLPEAAYNSSRYEHMARLSDVTTLTPRAMHEARLSLRWHGETDTPLSTAPQVSVAGAFTGGGASVGNQKLRQLDVEWDDDAILTTKKHTVKLGTQMFVYRGTPLLTSGFNGSYSFGGGTAPVLDANGNAVPGQTQTITGVEQYRRAKLGLAGGAATAFTDVEGTPLVQFVQVQEALFVQDDWAVTSKLHVAAGVRYYWQTAPTMWNSLLPRVGVLWSPNKKGTWTLHAHAGMFNGSLGPDEWQELLREDGKQRVTNLVYNPVYGNPLSAGATVIRTQRALQPGLSDISWSLENVGGTRTLPGGFNLSLDLYLARIWNDLRSENLNSPLNGSPTGPRALGIANLNLLQVQNSGQGAAKGLFAGLENHANKYVQFFVGTFHIEMMDDTDDSPFFTPQSAFSNAGEFARRTRQPAWQVFGNFTAKLPAKVQFSGNLNTQMDSHYNVTTGFDNNGDGDFNDRPQYAAAGSPGAVPTKFGWLTASGGTGTLARNTGRMPGRVYLDANVQRAWVLTRNKKNEHQQTLTLNARSSNVLNHTNVTAVGGVLGSPLFDVAYAADNGRRVELGARYSF